jgi:hypothetical protein
MVTALPGGGGDKGGLGGSSVGIGSGVPVPAVGIGDGGMVPLGKVVGVSDLDGVRVGLGVAVAGPGYGAEVFVICGPGYSGVIVGVSPGPGYPGNTVSVPVGDGVGTL